MLHGRSLVAGATLMVALLSSGSSRGQFVAPGPPPPVGLVNALVTGVQYDIVNQAKAEQRLQKVEARLSRDAERGDQAAVQHDIRRINVYQNRIAVDEWLIRKNSLLDPGCYPYPTRLDPISCAAIGQYHQPYPTYEPWPMIQASRRDPSSSAGPRSFLASRSRR